MKHWIDEAVENGFMPEGEDMAALQAKIAVFDEIKRYLDAQADLMKNPYYQFMAKDDISYTDKELEHLRDRTENPVLKNYLSDVATLRGLHYVRSKGISSSAAHSKAEGKRQAEILATKNEKRELIEKLSDLALNMKPNKRFTDKDYDSRFTKKLFEESLARFKAMDIKDIHFAGVKDITEHFEENQYMFDQMHDLEHLLFVAVQRGLAPSDAELVELRAKIEAFTLAEDMMIQIQNRVLKSPDDFVDKTSYKELEDGCYNSVKNRYGCEERLAPPKVGCDLDKYLKSMIRRHKQEHKDRKKTITLMYGLSHPQMTEDGYVPGSITEAELEKRAAEYQKNAYNAQYMRNLETYIEDIYGSRISSVAIAHARKTGNKSFSSFGRTYNPFLTGKSADEIIRVVDIMQSGSDEEKEELWLEISKETHMLDLGSFDARDKKTFFGNAAARARMAKIMGNIGGSSTLARSYIKNHPEVLKKNEAVYSTNAGFDYSSAFSQAARCRRMEALGYEDWFETNAIDVNLYMNEFADDNDLQSLTINGIKFSFGDGEKGRLEKGLGRFNFMHEASKSHRDRTILYTV